MSHWGSRRKVRCRVCGEVFPGRPPLRGDGSVLIPAIHDAPGGLRRCPGSWQVAEEVEEIRGQDQGPPGPGGAS